jgi:hypothetical protein
VFVAAAEGGGIRAAYWTGTVLGGLAGGDSRDFAHHLFAVSGISGGTLGAAVYAAILHDRPNSADIKQQTQAVLRHDFLSPTTAQLVSGDFLQWLLPLPVHYFDRSRAMEASFMRAYEREIHDGDVHFTTLGGSFTVLEPNAQSGVPALVMNQTIVETGARAIIAPFTWTATQIPNARDYTRWTADGVAREHGAAPVLATAIHNSARFTYISPAGLVRSESGANLGHVVDGGYFDPTGADTLLDLVAALQPLVPDGVKLIPIYITNATVKRESNDGAVEAARRGVSGRDSSAGQADVVVQPPPAALPSDAQAAAPVEILGELFAPLRALLESRGAHGRLAVERQRRVSEAITFGFCPMIHRDDKPLTEDVSGKTEEKHVTPPLGWQLSPAIIRRLDAYWTTCRVNEKGIEAVKNWLTLK